MTAKEIKILRAMKDLGGPTGAISLSRELGIPSASIGRVLVDFQKRGLVEKINSKGRAISQKGLQLLEAEDNNAIRLNTAQELLESSAGSDVETLRDIIDVRLLLEEYAVSKCTENVTEEQLEDLEDLQLDYLYAIRHNRSGAEEDLKFHLQIAEYSGNQIIPRILSIILTDREAYAKFARAKKAEKVFSEEHEKILSAIREGDSRKAAQEMRTHLMGVYNNVVAYYRSQEETEN